MKKYLITTLFILSQVFGLQAQDKNFFDKITLRKSFQSKADKAEAASLTFNKPKDTAGSWAANLGLGYKILEDSITTLEADIEFHKNTLVSKKQDSRELGLAFRRDFFTTKLFVPFLIVTAKYNADKEKME